MPCLLQEDLVSEIHLFAEKEAELTSTSDYGLDPNDARIVWHIKDSALVSATKLAYKDLKQRSNHEAKLTSTSGANKPIHQAAQLVHSRKVDAGLAGCVLSTAEVLRAIITHIGCRKPVAH